MMERIIAPFTELVLSDLSKVEERMRELPPNVDPNLKAAIRELINSGGKRLRPTLTLLSGEMLGADPQRTINLAAAIEMLHTATLVHDDLIDGALLRRGNPTLNAQWSAGATVLSGDFIFARAAYLAAETRSLELMRIFAEKLMVMVNGEIAQLFGTSTGNIRKDYFNRIYEKTASLFEVATHGASLLSECDDEIRHEMKIFGYEIGIAFQIIDDILDFTGDQEKVGKPVGSDLRQGLITLPAIRYIEAHPNDPDKDKILNGRSGWNNELEPVIHRIRNSEAIQESFEEARDFITSAQNRLSRMPSGEKRDALFDLADYTVQRPL
jgi:geranylgeranyl pyrophosphate synthase